MIGMLNVVCTPTNFILLISYIFNTRPVSCYLWVFVPTKPIETHTHTHGNPHPWSWVWVSVGMGVGLSEMGLPTTIPIYQNKPHCQIYSIYPILVKPHCSWLDWVVSISIALYHHSWVESTLMSLKVYCACRVIPLLQLLYSFPFILKIDVVSVYKRSCINQ